MIFQKSEMYLKDKIGLKSNGKYHPKSKASLFPYFFNTNRIFCCLGGILEASWAVLAKISGRLGPQLGSNLDPKMALELPKSGPRGAYRSPMRPLGAKNRPKAAQNRAKPPQGGAQTPSESRFWGILARI